MVGAHHTQALALIVDELVPAAEEVLPTLRKPLAEAIKTHTEALKKNVICDVPQAMLIYGRSLSAEQTAQLAALAAQDGAARHASLEALADQLRGGGAISIAGFVQPLVGDLKRAMELQARGATEGALVDGELLTIIRGDSAFRTLHYFLELTQPLLEKIQPRSMLSLRSSGFKK